MIIERLGKKYWCPDGATVLDETTGVYSGIPVAELVPYDLYVLQQELATKQEELSGLQAETTDEALLAWAKTENPSIHMISTVESEIATLQDKITNYNQ